MQLRSRAWRRRGALALLTAATCAGLSLGAAADDTAATAAALRRIRDEARRGSLVVETARHLCEGIGPRLTGTPQTWTAARWTRDRLAHWGISNAHIESWGPCGRGWTVERSSVRLLRPRAGSLTAVPKGWTVGTPGPVRGFAQIATLLGPADLARERGRLRGKVVLLARAQPPPRTLEGPTLRRLSEAELASLATPLPPAPVDAAEQRERMRFQRELVRFLEQEHVLAAIEPSPRDGDSVLVARPNDFIALQRDAGVPTLAMAARDFNRVAGLVEAGGQVELELDIRTRFHTSIGFAPNVLAELPGSDLRDEVVLIGAHLDSWHGGTGATDNAAGVAMAMEALRLLQQAGLRPRRTIRVALWTGEELGLLGSRAYVARHYGTRDEPEDEAQRALPFFLRPLAGRLHTRPGHSSFAAYFNMDYGTGRIRGLYLQGNPQAAPLVTTWLAPLADLGVSIVSPRSLLGSDHQAFESVGLPGFPFVHDDIEYTARTHHTTDDVFERLLGEDLLQASVVAASVLFQAAQADARPPRPVVPLH